MVDETGKQSPVARSKLVSRRRFLAGSAGTSTVLLAGCMGGDGDGGDGGGGDGGSGDDGGGDGGDGGDGDGPSGRVTALTTPEGSAGHVMGNGLMSLISQETDLTGSAQAGTGSQANIAAIMNGDADFSWGVSQILWDAYEGNEPFDQEDFEYQPLQLHTFYNVVVGIGAKTSSDYQYISDLEGRPIAVGPRETSFYPVLEAFLTTILDDYNPVYQAPPDIASQLAADNVDAAIILSLGSGDLPSWTQETVNTNDIRMLGVRDENVQSIRDNPAATSVMQSNDFWSGVQEYTTEGETLIVSTNYNAISSMATSEDVIYTVMRTAWDNRDGLTDVHPAFQIWQEDENWVELCDPRLPFHPGAAQFLQEEDLWRDDFQVAEG